MVTLSFDVNKLHIDAKLSSANRLGVMRLLNIATHVPWKKQLEFFAFQLHSVLYFVLTTAYRRGNQDPQGNEDNLRCFVYSQFLCVAKHNNIWTVNSIPPTHSRLNAFVYDLAFICFGTLQETSNTHSCSLANWKYPRLKLQSSEIRGKNVIKT